MNNPNLGASASNQANAPVTSRYARKSVQTNSTSVVTSIKSGAFMPHASRHPIATEQPEQDGRNGRRRARNASASNAGRTASGSSCDKPSVSYLWTNRILQDKKNPYFAEANHTTSSEAVFRWNGTYLEFVGTEHGSSMVAEWLYRESSHAASISAAKNAWLFGAKMLRVKSPMPKADLNRNIIPCQDVYLEILEDGTIKALQPSPDLGMTFAMNVAAKTPVGQTHITRPLPSTSKFRKFIERALPDPKVREVVQEQCGMALLPKSYQMAAWWVGAAGSGKSTLAELCKAMQRQVATLQLDQLKNRFALEPLVGASLIIVPEVEFGPWNEGAWKSLVGGDSQSVDRKNEKALVGQVFRAKWIIISNTLPFIRDKTNGVWRRLCIVPFDAVIPESERQAEFHETLLREEGDLILDWMLEGARSLAKRGRFLPEDDRPAALRMLKETARDESDSVRAWVKACCVRKAEYGEPYQSKDDVYAAYMEWCDATHTVAIERNPFWKGLRQQIGELERSNKRVLGTQKEFTNVAWRSPVVDV